MKMFNEALHKFYIPSTGNKHLSAADIDEVKALPYGIFSKITDRLYISSIGVINGINLIMHDIQCVFDLAHEFNYTIPDPSIEHYEYKTLRDCSKADLTQFLDDIVNKMEKCDNEGKNFVIHCVAGASRSGAAVVAFLVKHHHMTLKEAFVYSHSRRRVIRPNNNFMKQLINFERKHHGMTSVKMIKYKRGCIEIEDPDFFGEYYPELLNIDFEKERNRGKKAFDQGSAIDTFKLI